MAIKTIKEIIDNKGYIVNSNDRAIFEQGNLQSFFGFGEHDAIECIIYDINDNQLPQNGELVRYIPLTSNNISDYLLIAEGTILTKYQLPTEYFIDVERILREAGYDNGIFKTQITLLNKKVGTEKENDKLWISEISPSRTEVRLYPIRKVNFPNPELEERFNLFVNNGEFRDDTINLAFNFIEQIKPNYIGSFVKSKYSEGWYNKLIKEFKISSFDVFCTQLHSKFVEACMYEFTNRISDIENANYGKPKNSKPSVRLAKTDIKDICRKILVSTINHYLYRQDIHTKAEFDSAMDSSIDEVGQILQKLESNQKIDTSNPVSQLAVLNKPFQTAQDLHLDIEIRKTLPVEVKEYIPIVTPDTEPPYIPPVTRGGGGGNRREVGGGQIYDTGLPQYYDRVNRNISIDAQK